MKGLLLIDDEEGVRRSLTRALKRESYEVFVASDGPAGIELAAAHRSEIGVVISDYKMPGPDGLETLAAIGRMNPEVARILLTGYATMEAAIRATNEGLDGFLTKPFDNVELRNRIRDILVKKRLQQFVSHQVYEEVRRNPVALVPQKRQVTTLFCDIRGFTKMTRQVSPEEITHFLNSDYFIPLGEIAHQFNGTVDKHIGDCMMVTFGAPVAHEDDAIRAVQAALAMQDASVHIDKALAEKGTAGLRLNVGIGICTGEVVTGVFGSLRKREYTAFGNAVNMAARLEKLAAGGQILANERTLQAAKGRVLAEPVEPFPGVKGVQHPITIYRVLGIAEQSPTV
jgi:class 3 adenylate cyclase